MKQVVMTMCTRCKATIPPVVTSEMSKFLCRTCVKEVFEAQLTEIKGLMFSYFSQEIDFI